MKPGRNHRDGPDRRPRGFVLRPPGAVVDAKALERSVAARHPGGIEPQSFAPPLPREAVEAFELAGELGELVR